MEHLLFIVAPPISKTLVLVGGGIIGLFALMNRAIAKAKGSFKPYQKSTLFYLFLNLLFFALIGLTAHPALFTDPETFPDTFLMSYQVCFLLCGMLHYRLMHRHLKWSGTETSFWPELIFTLLVALLGYLSFLVVYNYLNPAGLGRIMAASILTFPLPFFIYHSFKKAVAIPPKIRKQWLYPVHEDVAEPDESKLKNLLIISFEFQKHTGDTHFTNFRAKAPTDMEFGQLFYYFINDYNERHPNSKIQFIDGSGTPHGWVFYKKPKWYSFTTSYIDTDKTIYNNHIRENEVIICTRSLN